MACSIGKRLLKKRIFVLSLQGDTLQVYTHPVVGQLFDSRPCCFDGKLLAPIEATGHGLDEGDYIELQEYGLQGTYVGVVALTGV